MELSILIPSRNEEWLAETLEDLIRNKTDKTEIIVVIDGEEFPKPLPQHKDIAQVSHSRNVALLLVSISFFFSKRL